MRYLILSYILILTIFSGCSTEGGGCCESMEAKSSPKTTPVKPEGELNYEVKSQDPVPRPDPVATTNPPVVTPTPTEGDPVAVITGPTTQTLKADERVRFNCDKSYDTDEQGSKIVSCEWTFECHKKDGYTCNCPKKGNINVDVSVKPHKNSDYMIAHLKVTDDEGVTNETSIRYDIVK